MSIDNNFSVPDMTDEGSLSAKTLKVDDNNEIDLLSLKAYIDVFNAKIGGVSGVSNLVKFDNESITLGTNVINLANVVSAKIEDGSNVIIKHNDGTEILDVTKVNERFSTLEAFKSLITDMSSKTLIIYTDPDTGEVLLKDSKDNVLLNATKINKDTALAKSRSDIGVVIKKKSVAKNIDGTGKVTEDDLVLVDIDDNIVLDTTELNKLVGDNGAVNQLYRLTNRTSASELAISSLQTTPFLTAVFEKDTQAVKSFTVNFGNDDEDVEVFNVEDYRAKVANYPVASWNIIEKDGGGNSYELIGLRHPLAGEDEISNIKQMKADIDSTVINVSTNTKSISDNTDLINTNTASIDKIDQGVKKVILSQVVIANNSIDSVSGRLGGDQKDVYSMPDPKTLTLSLTDIEKMHFYAYSLSQYVVFSSPASGKMELTVKDGSDISDSTIFISVEQFIS